MANMYRQFSLGLRLNRKAQVTWFKKRLIRASKEDDGYGGTKHCFEATVYPTYVWFRDNGGYGDVGEIADIVQEYLQKYEPDGYFKMAWADTCTKPRLGAFGGGFAIVTAKKTHWFNEPEWAKAVTKGLKDGAADEG